MKNEQKVSKEEQTAVGRKMLSAALDALGDVNDDEDASKTARRVVRALAAAAEVESSEQKRLRAEFGALAYVETDAADAVATAFWLWSERIELSVEDVHATSVAGGRLLGFAQGMAAAAAMNDAMGMLNDSGMFSFVGGAASRLAAMDD